MKSKHSLALTEDQLAVLEKSDQLFEKFNELEDSVDREELIRYRTEVINVGKQLYRITKQISHKVNGAILKKKNPQYYDDAVSSYKKHIEENGGTFVTPNDQKSIYTKNMVVLVGEEKVIGAYKIKDQKFVPFASWMNRYKYM